MGEVKRSTEAERLWESVYETLKASRSGSFGKATERARPQVMRLALLYALLDSSPTINTKHLQAALSVWRYCEDSACVLFGSGEPSTALEQRLLDTIRQRPGILRTELRLTVSHKTEMTSRFNDAMKRLVERSAIVCVPVQEGRSKAERYYVAPDRGTGEAVSSVTNSPNSPIPPANTQAQSETSEQSDHETMTVSQLIEWRNAHAIRFERLPSGLVWVTTDYERLVTPTVTRALNEHQETLAILVGDNAPVYSDVTITDAGNGTIDEFIESFKREYGIDDADVDDGWIRDLAELKAEYVTGTIPPRLGPVTFTNM